MDYPKTYESVDALPSVAQILHEVLPRLLEGEDPVLLGLRAQQRQLTVGSVQLSGVGFFAELIVPPDIPAVSLARMVGGNADIQLTGVMHGAGCVLFVEEGRLALLEGYTNAGEEWHPDSRVLSIGQITPLSGRL
jgi:hypothetical protein